MAVVEFDIFISIMMVIGFEICRYIVKKYTYPEFFEKLEKDPPEFLEILGECIILIIICLFIFFVVITILKDGGIIYDKY